MCRVLREDKRINGCVQNEEHTHDKHQKVTKRSPRVLRDSAILRRQFFIVDERKKLLPYRFRTVSDDLHLGKGRSGQNRLEEPEDPRHKRGDVHEKLACLAQTARVSQEQGNGAEANARGIRDNGPEIWP